MRLADMISRWEDFCSSVLRGRAIRWITLLLGIALVLALWASTLLWVPLILSKLFAAHGSELTIAHFGSLGDMFGAVNALFSGLALGAIALTLWLEARSRREARKPLVLGAIESKSVEISRPYLDSGAPKVRVAFPVKLSNQTADAALNVALKLRILVGSRPLGEVGLDGPLLRSIEQEAVVDFDLAKRTWEPLLDALTSQRDVEVELSTTYRSLEGINWRTVVSYRLFVRPTDQHYGLLDTLRNGTWGDEGVWQNDASVAVSAEIKQGSWDHGLN